MTFIIKLMVEGKMLRLWGRILRIKLMVGNWLDVA